MSSPLRIGQRVRIQSGAHNGSEGHVRFFGRTEFKEGEWIGLELDEPAGKNNGTVAGVTYFNCVDKHGIFLKSGSAIEVLEQPKPAPKAAPRQSIAPARSATNVRPTPSVRPRPSVGPVATKRPSMASGSTPSAAVTTAAKRQSISSQSSMAPPLTSRLSTAGRSISPKKPVAPSVASSSTSRMSLAGARAGVPSPSAKVASPAPSVDRVLSPSSLKSDQRSMSNQSVVKAPVTQSKTSLQQNRLVEELQTKVQFLEKKRIEDREKVRKVPELEEKAAHFESIIQKLQGKFQTIHQENGELKKQMKESASRLEELESLQAEHESIEELAILDRQLAEDQADSMKAELSALQSRLEELELENDILKDENEELGKDISPEEKASQGWLQLQRENSRLRDALIRLRDWSQEQQENLQDEVKLLEQDSQQLSEMKGKFDETKTKLLATEADNEDLREQLDAASGAETMLEQLTDRNLDQAAQLDDLRKTVEHLEFVQELNNELEVNHVEHEKQLQDVIDVKDSQLADLTRFVSKQDEELTDREYTISRFRDLVTALQVDLDVMRSSKEMSELEAQNLEHSSRAMMDLNRQLQASATSVTMKAIDIELRQLEADQASNQLFIIQLFVPEAFQTEKDSILSLLRFKRIGFKARLLHGFIKQRLSGSVAVSSGVNIHAACDALDRLVWTSCMCDRFVSGIETSPLEQFARFEGTFQELESVERSLNGYIENLKKDELEEQQVAESLSRSTAVIKHLAEIHLRDDLEAFAEEALMKSQLLQSALENAATILTATQIELLQISQEQDKETEDFALFQSNSNATLTLLRTSKVIAGKLYNVLRDMKSRSLSLEPETESDFDKCCETSSYLFNYFQDLADCVMKLLNEDHTQTLTFTHILMIMRQASSNFFKSDNSDIFYQPQKQLKLLSDSMNELYSMASEFENLTEFETPQPPWIIRSKELQNRKAISAVAEEEIKNLKRDMQDRATNLKMRQQQLEEANMKIELLEKRSKDANRKLDQLTELEKQLKSSKENEKTLEVSVQSQAQSLQILEEEREHLIRKASEMKTTHKRGDSVGRGAEMVGTSHEMESLKSEIQLLQSTIRYLRQQLRRTQAEQESTKNSWLSTPLRAYGKQEDRGADIRATFNSIALLPLNSKLVKVQGKVKSSQYGKETPKYQLIEQEIKRLKAWDSLDMHWKGPRGRTVIAGVDVFPDPLA